MVWVQSWALAQVPPSDPMRAFADQGSAFAREIRPLFRHLGDYQDGTVTLYPGTASALSIPLEELYPDVASPLAAEGTDPAALFGNDQALRSTATGAISEMDALEGPVGEAWRAYRNTQDRVPPPVGNDPMFDRTEEVLDGLGEFASDFAECRAEPVLVDTTRTIRIPEERSCIRPLEANPACTVEHTFQASSESWSRSVTFPYPVEDVVLDLGAGRVEARRREWVRERGRPASEGGEEEWITRLSIDEAVSLPLPALPVAHQCGGGGEPFDFVSGPGIGAPRVLSCASGLRLPLSLPPITESCQMEEVDPRDSRFALVCRSTGGSSGELAWGFASASVSGDEWFPPDCISRIQQAYQQGCTPNLIVNGGEPVPSCLTVNGVQVCVGDPLWQRIAPAPFDPGEAQVPRLARSVALASLSCPTASGEVCFEDLNGEPYCFTVSASDPMQDSCAELQADPACTYVTTYVVEDSEDAEGRPTLVEDIYDCGRTRTVSDPRLAERLQCSGPVRGMGDDLVSQPRETSNSFGEAAARLSAARFMAMDLECVDETSGESDPAVCEVFQGEGRTCKVAVFGIQDCCDTPTGVGLGDYLTLAFKVAEVDGAIRGLEAGNQLRGAYEALTNPVVQPLANAWGTVQSSFTTAFNSVIGNTVAETGTQAGLGLITSVQNQLMQQLATWTHSIFGAEAANLLFQVAPVGGGAAVPAFSGGELVNGAVQFAQTGIVGTLSSILSIVGWAYTIYSVATLLIQIIWACTERELELGVRRAMKSTHYVGSYCATKALFVCLERRKSFCSFSSPLSRILQQQIRPQLGIGWGAPRGPNCRGLTIDELNAADWSRVDLSEWLAIILDEGVVPEASEITPRDLTGSGHTVSEAVRRVTGEERQQADVRAVDRADGVDFDAAREAARRDLLGRTPQ